jgi:hypothetical protein
MHLTYFGVRFGAALNMVMNRVKSRGYGSSRHVVWAYEGMERTWRSGSGSPHMEELRVLNIDQNTW